MKRNLPPACSLDAPGLAARASACGRWAMARGHWAGWLRGLVVGFRRGLPRASTRALLLCVAWALAATQPVLAQGVELAQLRTSRAEGSLNLEFATRVALPKTAEDALMRGVPLYFVAEATLLRGRWYWRDERVARVSRSWRVAFQPLTNSWRVSLGGLNQSFGTLAEALSAASSSAGWRLADLNQLDPDKIYYVQFSYRLDTSQLPGPMQFGLGGGAEFEVGVRREFKVEP